MKFESIMLGFLILVSSISAQSALSFDDIRKMNPELDIVAVQHGRIYNSQDELYVAVYKDKKALGQFDRSDTVSSILLSGSGKVILKDFYFRSLDYDEYLLPKEDIYNYNIPNWNGYISIYDFNHDGIDEILSVSLWGTGLDFIVSSYIDGVENLILDDSYYIGSHIKNIEYLDDREAFIVSRLQSDEKDIPYVVEYPYFWSEQQNLFVLNEALISKTLYEK